MPFAVSLSCRVCRLGASRCMPDGSAPPWLGAHRSGPCAPGTPLALSRGAASACCPPRAGRRSTCWLRVYSCLLLGPLHQRSFLTSPPAQATLLPQRSPPWCLSASAGLPRSAWMEPLGFRTLSLAGPRAEGAPVPDGRRERASLACFRWRQGVWPATGTSWHGVHVQGPASSGLLPGASERGF